MSRQQTCCQRGGAALTSGTGLASFSLARASFLGSLLFTTNRPGALEDITNATDVTQPRKEESF